MQITPSVISPLGLTYMSARTDLIHRWIIKLHVLVFLSHMKKKGKMSETNTPPAAVKKKNTMGRR